VQEDGTNDADGERAAEDADPAWAGADDDERQVRTPFELMVSEQREAALQRVRSDLTDAVTQLIARLKQIESLEEDLDQLFWETDVQERTPPAKWMRLFYWWPFKGLIDALLSESVVYRRPLSGSGTYGSSLQVLAREATNSTATDESLKAALIETAAIEADLDARVERVRREFNRVLYSAASAGALATSLTASLGLKTLREEADALTPLIVERIKQLNLSELMSHDIDPLGTDVGRAMGAIGEIMNKLGRIRTLVRMQAQQAGGAERVVTSYALLIVIGLAAGVYAAYRLGWAVLPIGSTAMAEFRLPLLSVPWPVIVWSFVGSVAATFHRFNSIPSYNFTETVKWIVTRPVQGVLLGAATYLVLSSGLYVVTAGSTPTPLGTTPVSITDVVIMVVCFLVGFSDRVADGIFNTLVQRYPANPRSATAAGGQAPI
jgi:hypothetical protein